MPLPRRRTVKTRGRRSPPARCPRPKPPRPSRARRWFSSSPMCPTTKNRGGGACARGRRRARGEGARAQRRRRRRRRPRDERRCRRAVRAGKAETETETSGGRVGQVGHRRRLSLAGAHHHDTVAVLRGRRRAAPDPADCHLLWRRRRDKPRDNPVGNRDHQDPGRTHASAQPSTRDPAAATTGTGQARARARTGARARAGYRSRTRNPPPPLSRAPAR